MARPASVKYPTREHIAVGSPAPRIWSVKTSDPAPVRGGGTPILGEGLALRALLPGDRERLFELTQDPEQRRFGSPAFVVVPASVEDLDPSPS